MADAKTRVLLALIAVALWGLLLRSVFTPAPTEAQTRLPVLAPQPLRPAGAGGGTLGAGEGANILVVTDRGVYLAQGGNLFFFTPDLRPVSSAVFGRDFGRDITPRR